MVVRQQAEFITALDERILEYLDGVPFAVSEEIAATVPVEVSPRTVQERFRWLATMDFVAFQEAKGDVVELTTDGKLYLDGEVDSRLRVPSRQAFHRN
jgi:Mn-dependent DtxR family transcriptional regulator